MTNLADWIEYGMTSELAQNKRRVRGWLAEARGHVPVIDRIKFPDCGYDRRLSRRG